MRMLQKGHILLAVINVSVMGACQQETRATITVSTTTEGLKEEKAGRRRWHELEMKRHTISRQPKNAAEKNKMSSHT